ncbi:unnamed protein product [Rhizophagus irregularis]|nr:unnamed protein product [Rhizophagus irregularis]
MVVEFGGDEDDGCGGDDGRDGCGCRELPNKIFIIYHGLLASYYGFVLNPILRSDLYDDINCLPFLRSKFDDLIFDFD